MLRDPYQMVAISPAPPWPVAFIPESLSTRRLSDMKKSTSTEKQMIGFIMQAEASMPINELCRTGKYTDALVYK